MCPLDGALYSIAMRERYGDQAVSFSGGPHPGSVPGTQLPLKRVNGHHPRWFYAASFAQWLEPVAAGSEYWSCRLDEQYADLIDFAKKRGLVHKSSGAYKAYHMPVFYRHSLCVQWYVVGHKQSLERLLRFASHLGKKADQGWGAVAKWEIESWPHDWSVIGPGGRLMRAVPAEFGMSGPQLLYGFRPSYWQRSNQAQCSMPEGGLT